MNLADFRANGAFRQSSLSVFGNPDARRAISGRRCCLSAEVETEARVQQPPKMRKTFAVPMKIRSREKATLSEKIRQGHLLVAIRASSCQMIAPVGQALTQAGSSLSLHLSQRTGIFCFKSGRIALYGQAITHIQQPTQRLSS